ncbi:SDR family NAD(P)-dependent oxidoreductase [Halotalea alkalilenta]|uniref:SDR family NAD(P)-dependent oxidoreductase n=1 Tax=Halotalea alkalilenta TaxID=376489 RepID=UPI000488EA88|nr:SDR family oxidoreductase [Halotalea alkalilenta]
MPSFSLPTVLVTGAASGMGQACATHFLDQGWRVIALDAAGSAHEHPNLVAVTADIRDEDAVREGVDGALGDGSLDALVHAAGIFPTSNLMDFDRERYQRIFDVNVLGTLNLCRVATRRMSPAGGAMLLFASVDAFAVSRNQLLYSASKAAVVSIAKSLAIELADQGIVVNAIAPGWVDTPGTRAGGRLEAGIQAVPLKRAAQPEEIAEWAWRLCHAPGYVSGETLCVSGGVIVR